MIMAIISSSVMCLCCPIFYLFLLHVLLSSMPVLHCLVQVSAIADDTNTTLSGCLLEVSDAADGTNTSLVSPSGAFEFGSFNPDGKTETYWGIWYRNWSNPKIIVWIANRDRPLLDSNGYLVLKDGIAKLLDGKGDAHWSTNGVPRPTNKTGARLCLLDTGNLVLYERDPRVRRSSGRRSSSRRSRVGRNVSVLTDVQLWQSFDYPTDTFLYGMNVFSFSATSWETNMNPAQGNYYFTLLFQGTRKKMIISKNGSSNYWESDVTSSDQTPKTVFDFLSGNLTAGYDNTRLVMNFTGQIQLWKWESEGGWFMDWVEPKDRCSLYNICGKFSSCNSNDGLCKCLPGFKHNAHISGGCSPISESPTNRNDSSNDTFLQLPMMAVGSSTCSVLPVEENGNCTAKCISDPNCVAYSHGFDCSGVGDSTDKGCLIWTNVLTDLQEESPDGITLFVRTTRSDIDPTSRGCSYCGTFIIPYPLSTGGNCGDPSYFNFHCNVKTGQVNFSTPSGNFRVSSIDPNTHNFTIQVMQNSCDYGFINSFVLSFNDSFPFTYESCSVVKDQPLIQVKQPFIEVVIGWKPPLEPTCRASSDCNHWPQTTCKATNGGQRRCICRSKFRWNGSKLECTREVPFPVKVVVLCIAGALAIVASMVFVYHLRKRRMGERQGLIEFKEEDKEGIDVPFFNWESILAATNNFADSNKLGIGGFGSVYMGKLSDGREIAVKRLSSTSVQGVEEFRTEVKLIAKLQHRNLVRLVGYCMKADEKILVYEYMPNGSLASCLFDNEKHSVDLDWKKRNDIIVGIARGLLYLHQDSRLRIIHRDLKPSNILLDEELNPKISDFGIAKIVGGKETEASTGRIVGTYGYMSPEYASEGIFSVKSDVFSVGVVILETISGKRNSRIFMFEQGLNLLGYAWKLWKEEKGLELMDTKLNESCVSSEVLKCIHIGLLCVQEDPSDRPSMSAVVHMLSGENVSLPLAKQPAFMNRKPLSGTASSSSVKDSSMLEIMTVSTVGR